MTGHCRHCMQNCTGSTRWAHEAPPSDVEMVEGRAIHMSMTAWMSGYCPLCAEAERISTAIDAEAQRTAEAKSDSAWLYGRVDGLDWALAIARGDA